MNEADLLLERIAEALEKIGFEVLFSKEFEVEYSGLKSHQRDRIKEFEATFSNKGVSYKDEEEVRFVFHLDTKGYLQSDFIDIKISNIQNCIRTHGRKEVGPPETR